MWEIQLSKMFGLIWVTLVDKAFSDFHLAEQYVATVGLDKVYKDYRNSFQEQVTYGRV